MITYDEAIAEARDEGRREVLDRVLASLRGCAVLAEEQGQGEAAFALRAFAQRVEQWPRSQR